VRDGEPETGSGVSLPAALSLRADSGRYKVLRHTTPRDGAGFAPSAREIFPEELWGVVLPENVRNHNAMVGRLEQEALQEAARQVDTGKSLKKVFL
jgi:hypothetical protein